MDNNHLNSNVDDSKVKRIIMKLNSKQKAKIRREVDLELGVKAPRRIVFISKRIYIRKKKHKNNEE